MFLRTFFSLVVAAAVALPAAAQVRKAELAGVRNYSKVDATVGCAGATDPSAMKALRADGYVSVWHDSTIETREMALAYDAIKPALTSPIRGKPAADVIKNIEDRILRDALAATTAVKQAAKKRKAARPNRRSKP